MKVLAEIEGGEWLGQQTQGGSQPRPHATAMMAGWKMQNSSAARRFFVPTEYIVTAVK